MGRTAIGYVGKNITQFGEVVPTQLHYYLKAHNGPNGDKYRPVAFKMIQELWASLEKSELKWQNDFKRHWSQALRFGMPFQIKIKNRVMVVA